MRPRILLAGATMLIAGVVSMVVPVAVSGQSGESIGCGNSIAPDLTAARAVDDKSLANVPVVNQIVTDTSYVGDCNTALAHRRMWTIPLAVVGALAMAGALLVPPGRVGADPRGGVSQPVR